jgi:hypothetical protein
MPPSSTLDKAAQRSSGGNALLPAVLLVLACLSLAGFFAQMFFARDVRLVPDATSDADVFSRLQALPKDQIAALKKREGAAFVSDPLDRTTMQNLVVLHEATKEKNDKGEIYDILSGFTKRNIPVQVGAINSNIQTGDVAKAAANLDSLLRSHPEIGKKIYPLLYPVLVDDKTNAAFADVLKSRPAWRRDFMNELAEHDTDSVISYKLFTNLRKQNAAIEDGEFHYLFANLIGKKQYDKAYFMWLDFLPTEDLANIKLIYDGGFDRQPRNLFFDWNIEPRNNAKLAVAKRKENPTDFALSLSFFQDREAFYGVYQYLKLPSGQYAVSFESKYEQVTMPGGLRWRLRCAADSSLLGESEKILTSQPWTVQQFSIAVPEGSCDTQILRLEAASSAALDQQYDGQLYFDNFKVEKVVTATDTGGGATVSP